MWLNDLFGLGQWTSIIKALATTWRGLWDEARLEKIKVNICLTVWLLVVKVLLFSNCVAKTHVNVNIKVFWWQKRALILSGSLFLKDLSLYSVCHFAEYSSLEPVLYWSSSGSWWEWKVLLTTAKVLPALWFLGAGEIWSRDHRYIFILLAFNNEL